MENKNKRKLGKYVDKVMKSARVSPTKYKTIVCLKNHPNQLHKHEGDTESFYTEEESKHKNGVQLSTLQNEYNKTASQNKKFLKIKSNRRESVPFSDMQTNLSICVSSPELENKNLMNKRAYPKFCFSKNQPDSPLILAFHTSSNKLTKDTLCSKDSKNSSITLFDACWESIIDESREFDQHCAL